MVVGLRDGLKRIGISVVCLCAVFVCTFMLNYYLDVAAVGAPSDVELYPLYTAQRMTARFTAAISGGVLGAIAIGMLLFYVKLFVDEHAAQLGALVAIGYSGGKLAARFWVFGACVAVGCALGFAGGWIAMPFVYEDMAIEGMRVTPTFHVELLFALVLAPAVALSALACLFAFLTLRRPVMQLLKGRPERIKTGGEVRKPSRGFLREMCLQTLKSRKSLAFFVAFACFCFAAMVQMGASMGELSPGMMATMILAIGVILAAVTMQLTGKALLKANAKNIAVMKAFGYSLPQCALGVLGGYVPFALLGFGVGTVYQFGLLKLMVNVIFADVGNIPTYRFDVPIFFITLAAFVVCFASVMAFYCFKISKISIRRIMTE